MELNTATGGAGEYTGGRGLILEYRIRTENGFVTAGYTRSRIKPWSLEGGEEGSGNFIEVIKPEGKETHSFVSGLSVTTDDVIRVITSSGAGYGDPKQRSRESCARRCQERPRIRRRCAGDLCINRLITRRNRRRPMVKIMYLSPVADYGGHNEIFAEMAAENKLPGTEVHVCSFPDSTGKFSHIEYRSYEGIVTAGIIRAARAAAREGFDALAIGCFYDTRPCTKRERFQATWW